MLLPKLAGTAYLKLHMILLHIIIIHYAISWIPNYADLLGRTRLSLWLDWQSATLRAWRRERVRGWKHHSIYSPLPYINLCMAGINTEGGGGTLGPDPPSFGKLEFPVLIPAWSIACSEPLTYLQQQVELHHCSSQWHPLNTLGKGWGGRKKLSISLITYNIYMQQYS